MMNAELTGMGVIYSVGRGWRGKMRYTPAGEDEESMAPKND
jgi:hypothetical protein